MKIPLLAFLNLLFTTILFAQTPVSVDVSRRVRNLTGIENGVNLDYLMDGGFTKPAAAAATSIKNLGVKLLRYPGGEKSDNYLWSAAPWKAASPCMAILDSVNAWPTRDPRFVNVASLKKLCKPVVLDFDELMALCRSTGAQPLIVVAYDAIYNVKTTTRPTKAQLIENAVEWVRYANIIKKLGIMY